MLSLKLLPVTALMLAMITACGEKDDKKNESPAPRPEIPLNAPGEILGVWKGCNVTVGKEGSSTAIYNFKADGALVFTSEAFASDNCSGAPTTSKPVELKGSYVVGSDNALDLTFGETKEAQYTLYRVFSVQNETLLISNNPGAGADAESRDYNLNAEALKLTKIPPVQE